MAEFPAHVEPIRYEGHVAALFGGPTDVFPKHPVVTLMMRRGLITDVASLESIYDELYGQRSGGNRQVDHAVSAYEERMAAEGYELPDGLPSCLSWLAASTGMGIHVVLDLGDSPVVPFISQGTMLTELQPANSADSARLQLVPGPVGVEPIPEHLAGDVPVSLDHRPVRFIGWNGLAELQLGAAVQLEVPGGLQRPA